MNIQSTYRKLKNLFRRTDLTKVVWSEEDPWVVDAVHGSMRELKHRGTLASYIEENPDGVEYLVGRACERLDGLEDSRWPEEYPLSNYKIGLGTYGWKYNPDVIRAAMNAGIRFIDTAETYGYGRVETALGEALCADGTCGYGDLPLLVATKVSRNHMSYNSVINAANRSIKKLGLGQIGLYQIHWPNPKYLLTDTLDALQHLVKSGVVGMVGMCNYSVDQLIAVQNGLWPVPLASVQVRYNLMDREIERALLPYCQAIGIPVIAYSPLGQKFSRMLECDGGKVLVDIASRYSISGAQVALAWVMSWEGVIPIPRTNNPNHAVELAETVDMHLESEDLKLLDSVFVVD